MNIIVPADQDAVEPLVIDADGKLFAIVTFGSTTPRRMLSSFAMEKSIRDKWWKPKKGEVVFDVGAAYGSYTFHAAVQEATVYAFEPDRDLFFDLCTNATYNCFANVLTFNCVVGRSRGGTCYSKETHSVVRQGGDAEFRLVLSVDFFAENAGRMDWLKIDVEGAELEVLNGAVNALQWFKPKLIIECHEQFVPGIKQQVTDFLTPLGYVPTWIDDNMAYWEWKDEQTINCPDK